MKKIFWLALFVFAMSMSVALAHSGGLDQNGGHYDSNGQYHYHQSHSDRHNRSDNGY